MRLDHLPALESERDQPLAGLFECIGDGAEDFRATLRTYDEDPVSWTELVNGNQPEIPPDERALAEAAHPGLPWALRTDWASRVFAHSTYLCASDGSCVYRFCHRF